jgi:hypothetical protein
MKPALVLKEQGGAAGGKEAADTLEVVEAVPAGVGGVLGSQLSSDIGL